jgi:hypothetical protein
MDRSTAQAHLDAWLAADLAVASGQAYQIDAITVTRVDARVIQNKITYWRRVVESFDSVAAGGISGPALATFGARR